MKTIKFFFVLVFLAFPLTESFGNMKDAGGIKVLVLVANNYGANLNFMLDNLNKMGYEYVLCGVTRNVKSCSWASGVGLPTLTVDSLTFEIKDIKIYDCIFISNASWRQPNVYSDIINDTCSMNLIKTAVINNVVTYLPCAAPLILCGTNLLQGKKITGVIKYQSNYSAAGAIYLGENLPPVTDGNIITSTRGMYYHVQNFEAISTAIEKMRTLRNLQKEN